jgi:hybrid cluster-associated redox disulfide protein
MRVTEEMKVCDVLEMDARLEDIFLSHGMNCVGCPGSSTETIKEAAEGHGIELQQLIADLNKALEK